MCINRRVGWQLDRVRRAVLRASRDRVIGLARRARRDQEREVALDHMAGERPGSEMPGELTLRLRGA
jgi:hypothetical protein